MKTIKCDFCDKEIESYTIIEVLTIMFLFIIIVGIILAMITTR